MRPLYALLCLCVVCHVLPCRMVAAQQPGQPAPAADIQKDMDSQRINFSFQDRPMVKVVRQLRTLTTISLVYHPIPDMDLPITVDLNDTTVRQALDAICKAAKQDMDFDVIQGAVVIATKSTLMILRNKKPMLPNEPTPIEAEVIRRLDEKLDCNFLDIDFKEAVQTLSSFAKVHITAELPYEKDFLGTINPLDPPVFPKVHLALARVTLGQALFHLSDVKLNYGVFGNEIVISTNTGLALRRTR